MAAPSTNATPAKVVPTSPSTTAGSAASPAALRYPITRRGNEVDEYFGSKVADPYRWLEKPDEAETIAWVEAQNAVTSSFLSSCPDKAPLEARLKEVYNYERYSCPFRKGAQAVFYFHNSGLQNQSVLYVQKSGPESKAEVLLDPNSLSEDGTAALGCYAVSEDASHLAYGVARSGSDWTTIHVMRVSDRQPLEDKVEWVKFSGVSWTHDGKGFFYSRYPQPVEFKATAEQEADPNFKRGTETSNVKDHRVYYHRLGTKQSEDVLVHSTPDTPQWTLGAEVSDDGLWLLLTMAESCDTKNRLYYARLNADKSFTPEVTKGIVKLIDVFEAEYSYVTNQGSDFVFKTNHTAGRYRLIGMDLSQAPAAAADPSKWKTVLPEHAKDVLESASVVAGDKLIVIHSHDVQHVLSLWDTKGTPLVPAFKLPDVGAISGLSARKEDQEFFYSFTSFLYPGVISSVQLPAADLAKYTSKVFREIKISGFDASAFTTRQVFYPSKDGTMIPMFIVARRDVKLDASNPTWLYGYGGFNISLPPSFSVARLVWCQHFGGIFAQANLRGGGEYGEEWYKAGVLQKKQNVFDDFIAAAEYLIREKYTSPQKLATNGGSNGGLLVAACLNQRPDLYGAVVCQVGVLDMLKFHTWTIGYAWASDYGDSSQSKEMFEYLKAYSPVHNVRADQPYPALLLCTSDHDDRVVPLHSYKYAAEVQTRVAAHPKQTAPLLIRIEVKAGHGAGMPLSKKILEQADVIAFMAKNLGVKGNF